MRNTNPAATLIIFALAAGACDAPDARVESALAAIPDGADDDEIDDYMMTVDALADAQDPAAGWTWGPIKTVKAYTCEAPQGTVCGDPPSQDWCVVIKSLATKAQIPATYIGIMDSKCKANQNNACYECWDLANYCTQVGKSCTNIEAQCRCLGAKLGEI